MTNITICPKEIYSPTPITQSLLDSFEAEVISPLSDFIEKCIEDGVEIVFSRDVFNLIVDRAPWVEQEDPIIASYLDSWYMAIISRLCRFSTIETNDVESQNNCSELNNKTINNHFKNLIKLTLLDVKKTTNGLNHFGIYVKNQCSNNSECKCNIIVPNLQDISVLIHPWYLIYPRELPASGEYRFTPPNGWEQLRRPKKSKGENAGYLDENGHVWQWDKLHNNHWDVQRGGTGNYSNISPDGKILD